jgi:membrane-bound serine protease (ClpP class)
MITDYLAIKQYTIEQYTPSLYDKIAGFLTNPALQALMVTLIIGGIFFELKTPGFGLPSAVAAIAAVLYFLPLFISGTAESWELLAFVIGIILLIIELFVIPGFGVAGISGAVIILGALILAAINNIVFDFTFVTGFDISRSILTVLAGLVIAVLLLIFLSHRIGTKGMLYRFALHAEQKNSEGYVGVDTSASSLVGLEGTTITRMAPSGKVKVNGEVYDAVSLHGQYIEADTPVHIHRHENNQLYVTSNIQ